MDEPLGYGNAELATSFLNIDKTNGGKPEPAGLRETADFPVCIRILGSCKWTLIRKRNQGDPLERDFDVVSHHSDNDVS